MFSALTVISMVILKESAMPTRKNLKKAKVTRQECDDENTLLVMITERECSSGMSQDNYKRQQQANRAGCNRLEAEENAMVTTKEVVQCSDQWYLDSRCSTHMTER